MVDDGDESPRGSIDQDEPETDKEDGLAKAVKEFEEEKRTEYSEAEATPKTQIRTVEFGKEKVCVAMPREGSPVPAINDSTDKTRGRQQYSPPMIKEYDPNEENARTRAKKRKVELKKRREQSREMESNRTPAPADPRPWKGKDSEFFILHTPKKGTHKVLNTAQ